MAEKTRKEFNEWAKQMADDHVAASARIDAAMYPKEEYEASLKVARAQALAEIEARKQAKATK